MAGIWHTFKRFWNAEEVPRWFGLSLVAVYLAGLGMVAHISTTRSRQEALHHFAHSGAYAVKQLARRLSVLEGAGPSASKRAAAFQRALREFAANLPVRAMRVVDGQRRVIASIHAAEIGDTVDDPVANGLEGNGVEIVSPAVPGRAEPYRWIVMPIRAAGPAMTAAQRNSSQPAGWGVDSPGGSPSQGSQQRSVDDAPDETLFLAVRLGPVPFGSSGLAEYAGLLTAVLAALGLLFVIYRRLRAQLRGLSRIGERLQASGDRIREDLAFLHIVGIRDGVTTAWNELIDLAEHLAGAVERTEANEELSRVLQGAGGGALAEALNAVPDGIAYISSESRFEYVNASACRLFGWCAEEARQRTLAGARASGAGGAVLKLLRDALQPDGLFDARMETLEAGTEGPDGSAYRVWVIPLRPAHHQGECIVVMRDVSQQVRAERAREEFVTQVTHELRTPLTNIRAYAETLSSGMFDDPEVITDCYNVITKETRRLSRLIDDILSVSQLEVGTIELEMDDVDLTTLLSDGVRDIRGLADEKSIDMQLALPVKSEPIRADRDKLAVVLNNLLGNAIKYTPAGGSVVVGCQMTGDEAVVTVKDNGIGIAAADQARVFEKFQRADDPAVKDETGSGIGLFTAREIVRRHGGEIEVISEKEQGSTFLVRLPHRQSRATALSTAQET